MRRMETSIADDGAPSEQAQDDEADMGCVLGRVNRAFPAQHRTKLHSTNPLERLNKEVKRRADFVAPFPTRIALSG